MSVLSFDGKNDTRVIGSGSGKLEKCDDVNIIFSPQTLYPYISTHLEKLGRLTDKVFIGKVKTKSRVCIYMHIKS